MQKGEGGALVLSAEQEKAVEAFGAEKLEIRKALREVQHQLQKDIDSLGTPPEIHQHCLDAFIAGWPVGLAGPSQPSQNHYLRSES